MVSRRGLALRPIHTEKHEITWSLLGLNASGAQSILIARAVKQPSTSTEMETGSRLGAIFFETNLNGVDNSGVVQVVHWAVVKVPSGDGTFIIDPAIYDSNKKRFTFHRGMEMLPEIPIGSGGTVQTKRIFTVKLPKRFQRMGEDDEVRLVFKSSSASNINFCGIAIYKEIQ